jgi:hypothetical protein
LQLGIDKARIIEVEDSGRAVFRGLARADNGEGCLDIGRRGSGCLVINSATRA